MTSDCTECGEIILHGEGWSEIRPAVGPYGFPTYHCHHNACVPPAGVRS